MNPEISELLTELEESPAPTLDWTTTRQRVVQLHEMATTFEERGLLLKIHVVLMNAVEKMKLVKDVEEFKEMRRKDYNLLLIAESRTGDNIDPKKAACYNETRNCGRPY